ncbi:type III secretion needle formation regulating protein [Waddlia chondrophila 2032/99]|uniref:Type III secretion needle formation regulating protein n=2 Tax=Waddlia chondrophila TaxID=71667 RepID=F8LF09_9BACT|nr:DUF5398 domain-containing protein [Waddlia chondrophila]ADI38957.1 putative needle chaperone SctE [Waddlia chondrophila WSU 86-1044]CCB92077.1 type III secretion needle formation regulating protein [Waddlia chondrophila 2032/99]
MFGLEGHKKGKKREFEFELEKELLDPKKHKELKQHVENRIQEIKKILRDGENKKEFERFGLILHGYTSLLKVFSRFDPK